MAHRHMTDGAARSQFLRYLLAGLANTAVSYAVLVLLMQWTDYVVAYTLAYVLGIALGYWLQTRFVFRVPLRWGTLVAFPVGYMVQYLLGVAVLWLLVERFGTAPELAAFVVIVMNVPLGYVLNRYLLLPRTRRRESADGHD